MEKRWVRGSLLGEFLGGLSIWEVHQEEGELGYVCVCLRVLWCCGGSVWWIGGTDVCVDFWWVAVVVEEDGGFWGFRHDGGVLVSECGRLGKERRAVESDLQWGRQLCEELGAEGFGGRFQGEFWEFLDLEEHKEEGV